MFTGSPGKYVSLEDTISGFKGILGGKYDDLPEMAFYMVGDIKEVEEKSARMAKEMAERKARDDGKAGAGSGQAELKDVPPLEMMASEVQITVYDDVDELVDEAFKGGEAVASGEQHVLNEQGKPMPLPAKDH